MAGNKPLTSVKDFSNKPSGGSGELAGVGNTASGNGKPEVQGSSSPQPTVGIPATGDMVNAKKLADC